MAQTLRKQYDASLAVLPGERAVTASITTARMDREGEVLIPQGCDATAFQKSPTVFYNHDYSLPIGKCVGIHRSPDRLDAKTVFAARPEGHQGPWLPDVVFALIQQGVINGFSVGFVPIEGRRPTRHDRERFGAQTRYVHSKWRLIEYSVAPLPANEDALALAVSKGLVQPADITRLGLKPPREDSAGSVPSSPTERTLLVVLTPIRRSPAPTTTRVRRALLKAAGKLHDPDE